MTQPNIVPSPIFASVARPESLEPVREQVLACDPSLEVFVPDPEARFYEPDGVTYAIQLGGPQTYKVHGRSLTVDRGDLLVIPRELAVDSEGPIDLLAIRDSGEPPTHFRERFIQVWGVDHLRAAPAPLSSQSQTTDVVPYTSLAYRIPYSIVDLVHGQAVTLARGGCWHLSLLLCLAGGATIHHGSNDWDVSARDMLLVSDRHELHIEGDGRIAILEVLPEAQNLLRRNDPRLRGRVESPEYSPRPYRES